MRDAIGEPTSGGRRVLNEAAIIFGATHHWHSVVVISARRLVNYSDIRREEGTSA